MIPEVAITACWGNDTVSGGFENSEMFAMLSPHLNVGAQKWIVFGPAGWFHRARSFEFIFQICWHSVGSRKGLFGDFTKWDN
ncbi:hypothetical protein ACJIZ3_015793 [Penstemon smallii]|uniref:Uncharacterized protein n=1 Tax=Penstemon smallii TaxID=265156 RepID=A0ABD3RNM3_9LAMI